VKRLKAMSPLLAIAPRVFTCCILDALLLLSVSRGIPAAIISKYTPIVSIGALV